MNTEKKDRSHTPVVSRAQQKPRRQSEKLPQQGQLNTASSTSSLATETNSGNIKVVCRFRPQNQKEIDMGSGSCMEFPTPKTVVIKSAHTDAAAGKQTFNFDRVFSMEAQQVDIYDFAGKPIVESVLDGFNGTVFAYGQTSSGKTHTMQGPNIDDPEKRGIIPRMVNTLFDSICEAPEHVEFTVKVSIAEIYLERIRDLLSPDKNNLKIRQDKQRGVYIEDVTESYVTEEKDIFDLMKLGNSNRAISATNMNEGSSRSHLIFMLSIHQNNTSEMSAKTGKLYLVDLAGSEKVGKTGAQGQTLQEAKKINQSLSSLGNVINALTDEKKKSHIPYRDSKLTRLLQESLGGNSRTTLIITCSPSVYNEHETISTLRFGQRAKAIKNTPKMNKEFTVAELQLLLEKAEKTIAELTRRLSQLEVFIVDKGLVLPKVESLPTKPIASIAEETQAETNETAQEKGESKNSISSSDDDDANELQTKEIEMTKSVELDSKLVQEEKMEDVSKPATTENQLSIITTQKSEQGENTSSSDIIHSANNKIKALELSLESEKDGGRAQAEELNALKRELAIVYNKLLSTEKENETLIQKLAGVTMQYTENEELNVEKEEQFERLLTTNDQLGAEIAELKRSKEQIMLILDEKNEEIDILRKEKINKDVKRTEDLREDAMNGKQQAIQELTNNAAYQDLIISLQKSLSLKDDKKIALAVNDFFSHRHLVVSKLGALEMDDDQIAKSNSQADLSRSSSSEAVVLREKNNSLKLEMEELKQKYATLEKEKEKLAQDYENIALSAVPDYEELRKRAIDDVVKKERAKADRERQIIIHDLQNRVDKVVHLEMLLEEEQTRSKELETHMSAGDRALRKKILQLESSLEQLNIMYHQLASQRSALAVDNKLLDNRLQRKTDRINILDKQLQEAKESVELYKNKVESLKMFLYNQESSNNNDMMTQSALFGNHSAMFDGINSPDAFALGDPKRSISSLLTSSKIIKPIKGGGRKGHMRNNSERKGRFSFAPGMYQ